MSEEVLSSGLSFLQKEHFPLEKVKFFWWEPLIKKKQIQRIISEFPSQYTPKFYVTSNSTLVDNAFIQYARDIDLKVTFSIDGDAHTTAENRKVVWWANLSHSIVENTKKYHESIRVNQVITSANSGDFFKNFLFIYNLWVREFNFLPEYYREWTKKWLKQLQAWFEQILDFYASGNDFYLVNHENYSETSFFNLGIVIDTDGRVYGTNLILAWIFEKYKDQLCIGNIYEGISVDIYADKVLRQKYIDMIHDFEKQEYDNNTLKSVEYVDAILNNFVYNHKTHVSQN